MHPEPEQQDPDHDLAARIRRGDPAALQRLVDAKLPRIFGFARRMLGDAGDAEDVAQETLLRTWQRAPDREPGGPPLDAWMHTVAMNLCRDRLRRRRETYLEVVPDLPEEGPGPVARLEAASDADRVQAAIARLPARQREAVILCHFQEISNIRAAEMMEISVEALESLLSRGRRALRALLADLMA
jgi:RNA polymerase sigma-70 factor (ECF subfamily)